MEILKLIGVYLIQPALWLGIVTTVIIYNNRVALERKQFRIAINKDIYELRHFLKNGFILGIIFSIISFVLGVYLPYQIVIIYEMLALLALILFSKVNVTSLVLLLLAYMGLSPLLSSLHIKMNGHLMSSFFVLVAFYFIARMMVVRRDERISFYPVLKKGNRGRRIVEYLTREVTVIPTIILIPGDIFHSKLSFYPIVFGNHHYGIFILPLVVGMSMKYFKETKQDALNTYRGQNISLAFLNIILAIISYFYSSWVLAQIGLVLNVVLLMVLYVIRKRNDTGQWYVETNTGVRVIGIRPNTPASKMNLVSGDIILECNGRSVHNEEQLYAALQANSAYCNFKVQSFDGELKITESAIYADAPHEIGLVLFPQYR